MNTSPAQQPTFDIEKAAYKAFQVVRHPMMILTQDGDVCALNESALDLFHAEYGEIQNVCDILNNGETAFLRHISESLCSTQPSPIRTLFEFNGHKVDCHCEVRRLALTGLPPVVLVDISLAKNAYQNFRTLSYEFDELQRALARESKARELEEAANQAKTRFIATVSHEIRTPMNGILGMSQLLAMAELPTTEREYVETILKSGNVLVELLNDVLDFSKLESGNLKIKPEIGSLHEIVATVRALWAPSATKKGIHLNVICDPSLPESSLFDPTRVLQCVNNLVSNAIKFTDTGEVKLHVSAVQREKNKYCIAIRVTDTGIGLTEKDCSRVFKSFVQVDNSQTRRYDGTGLGLAITDQLARMMGGNVTAESKLGQGSVFLLKFEVENTGAEQSTQETTCEPHRS